MAYGDASVVKMAGNTQVTTWECQLPEARRRLAQPGFCLPRRVAGEYEVELVRQLVALVALSFVAAVDVAQDRAVCDGPEAQLRGAYMMTATPIRSWRSGRKPSTIMARGQSMRQPVEH
jgi:hypothetical protein